MISTSYPSILNIPDITESQVNIYALLNILVVINDLMNKCSFFQNMLLRAQLKISQFLHDDRLSLPVQLLKAHDLLL